MKGNANQSPFAGKLPETADLIDVARLLSAYETEQPDPSVASQRVAFGTSGHRGSSLDVSFNRDHILAISQALCSYRTAHGITGPLFLGFDTHALSLPAFRTTLEVLAANGVTVLIARGMEFTPTPAVSHAILCHNQGKSQALADGIVLTPSHNPPGEGGFKYNPTHGGPAEKSVTEWVQARANALLAAGLRGVRQIGFEKALKADTTHEFDFLGSYVRDLRNVIDMDVIRDSKIALGVDPLGGAGVHYWAPIAELYAIDLSILNAKVDPAFRFMPRDWDGKIRMDPSSRYAMAEVIRKSQRFDVTFACDTDHDRHGIVTKSAGLVPANDYLSVAISYLFKHRPDWPFGLQVGKTAVSSQMIDRVAQSLGRQVFDVPVGFKWFVDGLLQGSLGFAGEESAGAAFLRKDATVWTTDKDGMIPALLAAEMTAKLGKDPSVLYADLTRELGAPAYRRVEAPAGPKRRQAIGALSAATIQQKDLGGDPIATISTQARGNGAPISGVKIETRRGWVAMRPSGTEDIYKIYAESFAGAEHLDRLVADAQDIVDAAAPSE